ncbi:MAG TPA: hypothetical protein VLB85_15435 [Acidimicrobiia bacterium]|nr:hypothetical protein [Acidimicrobiia bacterium]
MRPATTLVIVVLLAVIAIAGTIWVLRWPDAGSAGVWLIRL